MAKILLIDDERATRTLVRRILASVENEVIEAADGQEGLTQFVIHRPHVVITDILMPEKEGIETIRELRRIAPTIWIIAMSGGGAAHDVVFLDFAKALGADFALAKPFRADELIAAVKSGQHRSGYLFSAA
jgi:DNA-binding response OmpR family regulator